MKIVGYQSGRHDVSYCILKNGIPILHEELERLIRVKEPSGDGLNMFFERIGETDDIDHFVFGNPHLDTKYLDTNSHNKLNDLINTTDKKHWVIGHHKSHAANAFFSSNFSNALIFTIDGGGIEEDGTSTALTVWKGINNKIEPIDIIPITTLNLGSPWRLYTREIFGLSSGYPKGNQSGTVMAMACVGNPDK